MPSLSFEAKQLIKKYRQLSSRKLVDKVEQATGVKYSHTAINDYKKVIPDEELDDKEIMSDLDWKILIALVGAFNDKGVELMIPDGSSQRLDELVEIANRRSE